MKPQSALILLVVLACAPAARSLRLEQVRNDTQLPRAIVDIENETHEIVAQLFVEPGETMKLDSKEIPAAGAGYYEAMPGQEYYLLILPKFPLPRMGREYCPCVLHMVKIGWNRTGDLTTVTGLRPFLETAAGTKIPILSDVKHPRIAKSKLFFKLQGRNTADYWVLTRFGQVVEVGGPWGLAQLAFFLIAECLPIILACALIFSIVGAVFLFRQGTHPDKSFIELMQLSLTRPALLMRKTTATELQE